MVYKKLRNKTFPHTKGTTTRRKPPKITRFRRVSIFLQLCPQIRPFDRFCLFWAFLFNKYFPPALLLLLHFPTLAAPAIFAPFPSIWRRFSSCPVLVPVQKFNAIKQPPFRFRCKLLTFTDFVDLSPGGMVIRLLEIVEIWGVSVRNTAYSSVEPCLKSRHYLKLFISSTKSGSQRRMLFKLDYFY